MISVCFVCLGNICRSPTAEGVMLHKLRSLGLENKIRVDSAGTSAYHIGERADIRSRECAELRGYELPSFARKFIANDFDTFDYIIAMDNSNLQNIYRLCISDRQREQVYLFRQFGLPVWIIWMHFCLPGRTWGCSSRAFGGSWGSQALF